MCWDSEPPLRLQFQLRRLPKGQEESEDWQRKLLKELEESAGLLRKAPKGREESAGLLKRILKEPEESVGLLRKAPKGREGSVG